MSSTLIKVGSTIAPDDYVRMVFRARRVRKLRRELDRAAHVDWAAALVREKPWELLDEKGMPR